MVRDADGIEELYPPFPSNLETIELPRISIAKLLEHDPIEAKRVFDICTTTGFFFLDVMDHPRGRSLFDAACEAHRAAKMALPTTEMATKRAYRKRERVGVFDMGYNCDVEENGKVKYRESINIPQTEMFADKTDFKLPPWLDTHSDAFKYALREGNNVANIILSILEQELLLEPGDLTSAHRLKDPSNDFLRILRYPGLEPGTSPDREGFQPHRDSVSIAILFTFVAGLQIPLPYAQNTVRPTDVPEEAWRWVEPLPGCAIVNLGDAMSILTNNTLKSGLHRVVHAPGEHAKLDRYSVLLAARPAHPTPMKAFKSPVIIKDTPEQELQPVQTCEEWGNNNIRKFYKDYHSVGGVHDYDPNTGIKTR